MSDSEDENWAFDLESYDPWGDSDNEGEPMEVDIVRGAARRVNAEWDGKDGEDELEEDPEVRRNISV